VPATLLLAACGSTTIVEPYYRPQNARVEQAYLSPSADFRNYTKLLATPLEIYTPDNAPPPDPAELDRLRATFREAFLAELGDDYEIVTAPGVGVMRVIAQIVDLKITGAQGTFAATGRLREVVAAGELTLLMEFRDSLTDRVLARVGESTAGTATGATDREASWQEVEAAAQRWARLFRAFLDENFGTPGAAPG
jgi:hypothetical protein